MREIATALWASHSTSKALVETTTCPNHKHYVAVGASSRCKTHYLVWGSVERGQGQIEQDATAAPHWVTEGMETEPSTRGFDARSAACEEHQEQGINT